MNKGRKMSKVYKFNCGAKLVYEKNKVNKISNISIDFRCGSSCDDEKFGLSNLTEHMFFTGTKDKNKQEITKEYFDFVGVNACTNSKYIKFGGDIFGTELGEYLSLVAKLITDSTFSQKNLDEEKKVVLQEIVEDNDNYSFIASREMAYCLYNKEYLRKGALGDKKSVESITSKDIKNFVKKYFVANNCQIFVASTLTFKKIKQLVENNLLSKLPVNHNLPEYEENEVTDEWISSLKKIDADKNFLNVGFKFNFGSNSFDKIITTDFLSSVMSNITDGILKELRLEKGLVYSGGFYISMCKNSLALIFKTVLAKENIKHTMQILADYLKHIKHNGIDKELIEQEYRETKFAEESSVDTPKNLCDDLESIRTFDRVITTHEINAKRLATSKVEIDNLIKENFGKTNVVCLVCGNADKKDCLTVKELKKMFDF